MEEENWVEIKTEKQRRRRKNYLFSLLLFCLRGFEGYPRAKGENFLSFSTSRHFSDENLKQFRFEIPGKSLRSHQIPPTVPCFQRRNIWNYKVENKIQKRITSVCGTRDVREAIFVNNSRKVFPADVGDGREKFEVKICILWGSIERKALIIRNV